MSEIPKRIVEIDIFNKKYHIKTDEDDGYIDEVVGYVRGKIADISNQAGAVGTINVAVLTALNIADDYVKLKKKVDNLGKRSIKLVETIEERV